jgi:hypothetical protein
LIEPRFNANERLNSENQIKAASVARHGSGLLIDHPACRNQWLAEYTGKENRMCDAPVDQKDLQQVFLQLRDLFDDGDYEGMRGLLHPNLIWKRLDSAASIIGAEEVIRWLKTNKAARNPQFSPDLNRESTNHLRDGSAQISGPAEWLDAKATPNNVVGIEYNLTFTTDRGGRWLLINVFARFT